jgi:hypothetical protein
MDAVERWRANPPNEETKTKRTAMKTLKTILLAGAVVACFTLASTAKAGEVFLSPRAQANQMPRVSGINADPNLVSGSYPGAASKARAVFHPMTASGGVEDINLVSGNYAGAAAKSPDRELRGYAYEIAPLIEKCHTGQMK